MQLEVFLKLLLKTLRKSWFPMFIFHWMRHCIPQELALPFPNTAKANRQNTGCYSEKILVKYGHLFISSLYWKINKRTKWTLSSSNWWYCEAPSYQLGKYGDIQGRNISCDHYYTSLDVANWLLGKKDNCWQKQF